MAETVPINHIITSRAEYDYWVTIQNILLHEYARDAISLDEFRVLVDTLPPLHQQITKAYILTWGKKDIINIVQ